MILSKLVGKGDRIIINDYVVSNTFTIDVGKKLGEKSGSDAKTQYKLHNQHCIEMELELNKGIALFLLKLPVPMSYEVWKYLHKIKGDYE